MSILTVTLAVGANLVVFTLVNALWLRPNPIPDPERVVVVMSDRDAADASRFTDAGLELIRRNDAFESVAGQVVTRDLWADLLPRLVLDEGGLAVEALGVTPEYFGTLGLTVRGRDFGSTENATGTAAVAIISNRLWQSHFRGDRNAIGRWLSTSPEPLQIIGIAPPGFHGVLRGENVDVWLPQNLLPRLAGWPSQVPEGRVGKMALARLRPGVTIREALVRFEQSGRPPERRRRVVPVGRLFGAPDRGVIVINEGALVGIAAVTGGLVLVGGCATLMTFVFLHYRRRQQELAVRQALGAGHSRILRQLAGELLVVITPAAVLALAAAALAVRWLPRFNFPGGIDLARLDLSLDWRVAVAGVLACVLTAVVAAAPPMLRISRQSAAGLVGSTATASRSAIQLRHLVLATHASATIVMLVVAGLFVETVRHGFGSGPGFDAASSLFVEVQTRSWSSTWVEQGESARVARNLARSHRLIDSIQSMPAVRLVDLGAAPIGTEATRSLSSPRRFVTESGDFEIAAGWRSVGAHYLTALGVPLLAGRTGKGAEAVVTTALAEQLWPGESPLGQWLRTEAWSGTVVGVADLAYGSVAFGRPAALFTLDQEDVLPQVVSSHLHLTVRADRPENLRQPIRELANREFPDAAWVNVVTGSELVTNDLGRQQLGAWFFSGFGVIGLTLAVIGVFALTAYLVEARRREFGVMMALGATQGQLAGKAMLTGLAPTTAGALSGLLLAAVVARMTESFLVGVEALDPPTYAGALVLLLTCALLASSLAAASVRRISAAEALRAE